MRAYPSKRRYPRNLETIERDIIRRQKDLEETMEKKRLKKLRANLKIRLKTNIERKKSKELMF